MLPPSPPPPSHKRPFAVLIGSLVALVVVLIAAIAGGSTFVLHQRVVAQASPQPSATATPVMPALGNRIVIDDDTLVDAAFGWPNDTHCFISAGAYHIKDDYFCYPSGTYVGSATISVKAEMYSGADAVPYGIAFRIVNQPHHFAFYFFGVAADGEWTFQRDDDGTWTAIVAPQPAAAIQIGPQRFSMLTVSSTGSHFVFYIGYTQVGSADDTALTSGSSGLTIAGPGEAAFNDFIVAN